VRAIVVPPVDTRDLSSKRDLVAKDVLGDLENFLTVLEQAVLVPGEEELTVVRSVVVKAVRVEEASVTGMRVPAAGVVGLSVAPLWVASISSSLLEISEEILVVDLEFTDTAVGPALVLLVARVAELGSGTKTDADTVDGGADLVAESRGEGGHEIVVHVKRSAAVEESLVVDTKVDVLHIGLAVVILVVDIVVGVTDRGNEIGKRNVALITDIATALVEAHDDLELKADVLAHRSDVLVSSEVVVLGAGLRKTPPNINHNTLDTHVLQSDEILLKLSGVRNTAVGDSIQRKHNINRNCSTESGKQNHNCS